MSENKAKPISFDNEDFKRVKELADKIGWSGKKFVEEAVRAIDEMHNTKPAERKVPWVVFLLDAARQSEHVAQMLKPAAPPSSANPSDPGPSSKVKKLAAETAEENIDHALPKKKPARKDN